MNGDDVALTLQGQYDNKNVGTGKQVDVTAGLLGGDAGNYRLTNTSLQSSGDITPSAKAMSVAAGMAQPFINAGSPAVNAT